MKKEVEEYYTPRTPDLATWHEFADQPDFPYLVVMGTLMAHAEQAPIEIKEEFERLSAPIITKKENAMQRLEKLREQHSHEVTSKKTALRQRIKHAKQEIRGCVRQARELFRDIKTKKEQPPTIKAISAQVVEDMPPLLKVSPSTFRQNFYVSKHKTRESDYNAHQSLDQVVQTGRSK